MRYHLTPVKMLLLSRFSCVRLCATPWTAAPQAPPSLESPGKNTGVGCHFLLQCMKVKMRVKSLGCVGLVATPWTAAHQAPPSTGFSRQEDWRGVPLPSPTSQNSHHQKVYKHNDRKMWIKVTPLALLVRMQVDTAATENSMETP